MDPDLMKDYLLKAFPNPERRGCPDEETIKALAERQASLNDPAMLHIASCSECYAEYLNYRMDKEQGGKLHAASARALVTAELEKPILVPRVNNFSKWTVPLVIAASLVCGVVGFGIHKNFPLSKAGTIADASLVPINPVPVSVDLFNAVTLRGGNDAPTPLQEVTLPAASVNLVVTLPRYSQSGSYTILVAKDRVGKQVVAEGSGTTSESQGRVDVHVMLDLRKATPGAYFLATIRGSDNGTYYYPLKVD